MRSRTAIDGSWVLACLLASVLPNAGAAQVTGELPNWLRSVETGSPTSQGHLPIMLSGAWHNSCAPLDVQWAVEDREIQLTLLRTAISGVCLEVITPWKLSAAVDTLDSGDYSIWAQMVNTDRSDPPIRELEWGPEKVIDQVFVPEPDGRWWLGGSVLALLHRVGRVMVRRRLHPLGIVQT